MFESIYRVQKSYLYFQVEGATEAASQEYEYNTGYFYMGAQDNTAAQIITGSNDKTDRAGGVDQWQRELGHGALNLVSVAHSS